MKNKIFLIVIGAFIWLFLVAFNNHIVVNNVNKIQPYTILFETYKQDPFISIDYPQLNGLKDEDRQNLINQLIKKRALEPLVYVMSLNESDIYTDISYDIKLSNAKILSICYIGNIEENDTDREIFYTCNISIDDATELRFTDFYDVTLELTDLILSYPLNDKQLNGINYLKSFLESVDEYYLVELLKNGVDGTAGSVYGCYQYYTENSIGFSMYVPHDLGDHFECEIPYKMLDRFLIRDIYSFIE
jgi:hypothetical protein